MDDSPSLEQLLERWRSMEGETWRSAQQRAAQRGFKVSHETLRSYASAESINARKVAILAAVLQLPASEVVRAYFVGKGLRLDLPTSVAVEDAISADGRLSTYDRRLLSALLREMTTTGDQSVHEGGGELHQQR